MPVRVSFDKNSEDEDTNRESNNKDVEYSVLDIVKTGYNHGTSHTAV